MTTNRAPTPVFGIETPVDMLAKLRRERDRTANASFAQHDQVDAATNFALTAWHLTDWTWHFRFADDPHARQALGLPEVTKLDRKPAAFDQYLSRRCPELVWCQDIALGFKHVHAISPDRATPGVAAVTASATAAPPGPFTFGEDSLGGAGLGGPGYVTGAPMYRLKITGKDGGTKEALAVFDSVVAFWTTFFAHHGI